MVTVLDVLGNLLRIDERGRLTETTEVKQIAASPSTAVWRIEDGWLILYPLQSRAEQRVRSYSGDSVPPPEQGRTEGSELFG